MLKSLLARSVCSTCAQMGSIILKTIFRVRTKIICFENEVYHESPTRRVRNGCKLGCHRCPGTYM